MILISHVSSNWNKSGWIRQLEGGCIINTFFCTYLDLLHPDLLYLVYFVLENSNFVLEKSWKIIFPWLWEPCNNKISSGCHLKQLMLSSWQSLVYLRCLIESMILIVLYTNSCNFYYIVIVVRTILVVNVSCSHS